MQEPVDRLPMRRSLVAVVARGLRAARTDPLYRHSMVLLLNTTLLALLGFVFWTVAARSHSAADVGHLSGIVAATALLGSAATLGLPNTLMRFLPEDARGLRLAVGACATAAAAGMILGAALVLLADVLPVDVDDALVDRLAVVLLVVGVAASTVVTAGLVAIRASGVILLSSAAGSVLRLAALLALVALVDAGGTGLLAAYTLGVVLPCLVGAPALWRRLRDRPAGPVLTTRRRYLGFAGGNYAGTLVGILPLTLMPILVLAIAGPEETAWFTAAFLIIGFVNFIPSTTAQVLLSEVSRGDARVGHELRRASRYVFALQLPVVVAIVVAAPWILLIYGRDYAEEGATCLRVLAIGTLLSAGNYLIDNALAGSDRVRAYAATNFASTALVLALFAAALPYGLAAAAWGWTLSQALSLLIGYALYRLAPAARRSERSASSRNTPSEPTTTSAVTHAPAWSRSRGSEATSPSGSVMGSQLFQRSTRPR